MSRYRPHLILLNGLIVTKINRIFDYGRGEIAEPVWITGGNPDLRAGSMQSLSLDANVRPFNDQGLTLSFGYRQSVAKGAISTFPEPHPCHRGRLSRKGNARCRRAAGRRRCPRDQSCP